MSCYKQESDILRDNRVVFYFNGPLSQAVIEGVGGAVRDKLRYEDERIGRVQKVFSILVEQMQNIVRYSTDRRDATPQDEEIAYGRIIVGIDEDGTYYVSSGNRIHASDGQKLHSKIAPIQEMTQDELRVLYKEMRKKGPDSDSKGAGLGFIEMARKSSDRLNYSIESIDDRSSYFSMKVKA